MIKRCPTCSRTYSDESISFCLADGTLLSAPLNEEAREAPPTEILPSTQASVPPTEPARPVVPTMTSLRGGGKYSPLPGNEPRSTNWQLLIWAVAAIVAVLIIGIGGAVAVRVFKIRAGAVAAPTPEELVTLNSATPLATPQNSASAKLSPQLTPAPTSGSNIGPPAAETRQSPTPSPATLNADPVLFPPDREPTPDAATTTDYNRIFRSSEVTSRARVLDKPEPQYTEVARKNQVTGTVVLRVVFSSSGQVTNISVIRGLPDGLSERAIAAARQIRFVPAMKDGRAVSMWMELEYNFNLY